MQISLVSFGYKYGIPARAHVVFDVRFISNPYYVKELRDKTGQSAAVQKYVLRQKTGQSFLQKSLALLELMVKEYKKSRKYHLMVAFGCTGGKHRSVVIAETMKKRLQHLGLNITVMHRDEKL